MFLTLSLFMVFTLINKCNKSYNVLQYEATIILQSKRVPQFFYNFSHQYVGPEKEQQDDFIATEHVQLKGSAEDEGTFACCNQPTSLARWAVVSLRLGVTCGELGSRGERCTVELGMDLAPWISGRFDLLLWAPYSEIPFFRCTQSGAVLQHSGLCGRGAELQQQTLVLYSGTQLCNHVLYNSWQTIQTGAWGCSRSANREEGHVLQFPFPAQVTEWILRCPWPPTSGRSSSTFPLTHPASAAQEPWPHHPSATEGK